MAGRGGATAWTYFAVTAVVPAANSTRRSRTEFGDLPDQLVYRGLAKLLEDRCDFECRGGIAAGANPRRGFPRLRGHAASLWRRRQCDPFCRPSRRPDAGGGRAELDSGPGRPRLFADLKSEQRLMRFDDTTPERLLERYNVSLAQAVLLRAVAWKSAFAAKNPQNIASCCGW